VEHVRSISIQHGKGSANELRCKRCYSEAESWNAFVVVLSVVGLIAAAIFFFGFFIPMWIDAPDKFRREMDELNRRWDAKQQKDVNPR
jgi:hypothetical protein